VIALFVVYGSDSCTGICDVRCYDTTTPACACICGGRKRGAGRQQAVINTSEHALEWLDRIMIADPSITAADIMPAVLLSPERSGSAACTFPGPEPEPDHDRRRPPGLLDVIAAFFAAEREASPCQVYLGPCGRTEPAERAGQQSPA